MPTQNLISVFEYEKIRTDKGDKRLTPVQLKALQLFHEKQGANYYSLIHNGIQFKQYVGVIQVGDLIIEVLPKADKSKSSAEDKTEWQKVLIGMLRACNILKVEAPSSSHLNLKSNSILHLYFERYLKEMEYLLHRGLVKHYRDIEENATTLKGNLLFNKHIQHNLVHQERFYVCHTTYDTQHLLHSILYEALKVLKKINTNAILQSRIGALLLNFPEMPPIKVSEATFEKMVLNRKDEHYETAIQIARLLLLKYHPDISQGRNHVLALMFDMNQLWEKFVFVSLQKMIYRKKLGFTIVEQAHKYFWKPENGQRSAMKPDIVINKNQDNCIVLDAKWKNLNGYNPAPEDLRQLYVYHKYFNAKHVALIYPSPIEQAGIRKGAYIDPESNKITDIECNVISIAVHTNIEEWQECIWNTIEKWATKNGSPVPN